MATLTVIGIESDRAYDIEVGKVYPLERGVRYVMGRPINA